ncbi:MAG: DUF2723 domain-containing protein [Flavobacteriales bacterium]|nr:DUF2723 domain-containing protein [Flavobacteriales bacterium]
MNYNKINNILGWLVFAIATWVYLATMEETTSLWDCGEYITTANKLEVGHPPGAPLFMMLGRLFSAFASPENAAMMVNAMSALSSSFTILFLFWTITMLVRKVSILTGNDLKDSGNQIAIFGSGMVGALAYTFTDSFWFSAVEGEVYAMSSFFTALVFWAIFKWEVEAEKFDSDRKAGISNRFNPNRWLIFISYMIGLSIGVHLLNLLAIPAIAYVIYFQKSKAIELKGFLITGIIGLMTLGVVQSVVIPKIPSLADFFERTFTNSFGMGFNSGFTIFMLLVIGLLTFGILYTSKKGKSLWNNIIVSLTMLLIGYSSFTMIVVRSNANPPLDENNPETLSSLVSYLNRDQYGSWPILRGPYWNSPTLPGCDADAKEKPKASFMKSYVAKLEQTQANFSSQQVLKIQEHVGSLGIPLTVAKLKSGEISVSTPQFKKWIYYNGEYVAPNEGIAAEMKDPLKYEISFITLFDFEEYKSKVNEVNEKLKAEGINFNLNLSQEASPLYINTMAGKAGEKKYAPDYITFLPRMYRQGEGDKYMAWINYDEHQHDTPLPAYENIPGTDKADQYFNLVQMAGSAGDPNMAAQYMEYAEMLKQDGLYKPNFMNENMAYMFNYQIGWMYLRYFMWNFSGRQNDLQGYGLNGGGRKLLEGNWLTGVDFVDQERLGSQDDLPMFITMNKGYNRYFMLPLILGLIGFIFHAVKAPKDMFSVLLLFLLTGLAIVFYLNQKPMEPRERDYAYAASFYAFAIWIGLGVYALFDAGRNFDMKKILPVAGGIAGGSVFILLVQKGMFETAGLGMALTYMSFVGLGVYLIFGFLGDKLKNTTVTGSLATILCLAVPVILGIENWDDHDRSNRTTARDFAYNYLISCSEKSEGGKGAIIFTNGDNDTFPLWYLQEVEEQRTDVRVANMSLLGTDWHISQMKRQAYDSEPLEITMNEFSYRNGTRDYVLIMENPKKEGKFYSAKEAMQFILDDNHYMDNGQTCQMENYIDFRGIYIPVDKEAALKHGIISKEDLPNVVDTLKWTLKGGVLYKSDLAVLDLLSNYKWDRPIYFASLSEQGLQANYRISKYMQSEGLAFKITPMEFGTGGGVNFDKMYALMMDKENGFQWGNMKGEGVLVDYYTMRMVYNLRVQIMKFTEDLIAAGENQMAIDVLDRAFEEMPIDNEQVPVDDICYYLCANYYDAGAKDKGDALAIKLAKVKLGEIAYYANQSDYFFNQMYPEFGKAMQQIEILRTAAHSDAMMKQQAKMQALDNEYQTKMQALKMDAMANNMSQQEYDSKSQEIISDILAKQAEIESDGINSPDDQAVGFKMIGFLEQTNYLQVMAKAKKKFMDTQNTHRQFYQEAKNFPRSMINIWNPYFFDSL